MSGAHWLASYAEGGSPVHRAPASLKLCVTLALVTGIAVLPATRAAWAAPVLVAVLSGARAARVPLRTFLARLAVVQPFVLGIAVLALFQRRGLDASAAVALKSTTSVAAVQLLAHTTPFPQILRVMDRWRVPPALVATLALLDRFLHVLADESSRMRQARAARTWRTRRWTTWHSLASVAACSFVRSAARAERIAVAMRARPARGGS